MTEETSSDSPRTDDIAASSILYQCADCVRAEADYSCFNAKDVFVIGKEVICRDCADAGHQGEQRRTVPDIAAKLKRQRMAIAHEQRRFAASPSSPASGVRAKALEWVKHPEVAAWRCDSIVGRYQVFAVNPGHASWSMDGQPGVAVGGFVDDADTAKAAAQADYESRILSALGEHP
jgi:hypothetical protein